MQAILSAFFFVKMKNHLLNLYVFTAALILIISLGLVGLASSEFYNVAVLQETDSYPFGSEGPVAGAWQYQNKENYIIFFIISAVLYSANALLLTVALFRKDATLIKWSISLFALIVLVLFMLQGNYYNLW